MSHIIKAEHLKFNRTFTKCLPVVAPMITLLLDVDALVPQDHLLRKIEKVMDYEWLYEWKCN